MHQIIEKIYDVSPDFIKDIMTSAYGYVLYRQRYTGKFEEYLKEQVKYLSQPIESLLELQNERLRKIIHHAYNNVAYYRGIFDRAKVKTSDIGCAEDLHKIPILEKDTVRNDLNSLVARNISKREMVLMHTSGTTGSPLNLYNSLDGLRYSHALEFFVRQIYGLKLRSRRASIIGRIIIPEYQTKPPFWHYNIMLNQYLFSSYHMSDKYLPHYIKKLEDIRPEEIVGYPSSLHTLARYVVRNNITSIRPKIVFGNSEPILDYQREVIESAFQCRVREWYSSTEQALFAYECEYRNYHIIHPYGIVEICDKNNQTLPDGNVGDVICTGLTNNAMPFIRYRLGDSGSIGSVDCPCGNKSKVFKSIIGRADDIIVTPDGKWIGRLDPVFKGMRGIKECQIIQKELSRLLLKVVRDDSYSKEDEEILLQSLRKRIGVQMNVNIKYTDHIPREKNGKFRAVISEVNSRQQIS